jgi:hypothetical protein
MHVFLLITIGHHMPKPDTTSGEQLEPIYVYSPPSLLIKK